MRAQLVCGAQRFVEVDSVLLEETFPNAIAFKRVQVLKDKGLQFVEQAIKAVIARGYAQLLTDCNVSVILARDLKG